MLSPALRYSANDRLTYGGVLLLKMPPTEATQERRAAIQPMGDP